MAPRISLLSKTIPNFSPALPAAKRHTQRCSHTPWHSAQMHLLPACDRSSGFSPGRGRTLYIFTRVTALMRSFFLLHHYRSQQHPSSSWCVLYSGMGYLSGMGTSFLMLDSGLLPGAKPAPTNPCISHHFVTDSAF